jgi:hypothetical protein
MNDIINILKETYGIEANLEHVGGNIYYPIIHSESGDYITITDFYYPNYSIHFSPANETSGDDTLDLTLDIESAEEAARLAAIYANVLLHTPTRLNDEQVCRLLSDMLKVEGIDSQVVYLGGGQWVTEVASESNLSSIVLLVTDDGGHQLTATFYPNREEYNGGLQVINVGTYDPLEIVRTVKENLGMLISAE